MGRIQRNWYAGDGVRGHHRIRTFRNTREHPLGWDPLVPPDYSVAFTDGRTMADVSIVVPTYNERENLAPLLRCLDAALTGIDYEVVIVDDDSYDNTAALGRSLARIDSRIRVLHRIGRRGLASAAVEGMLSTSSRFMIVMDADLQHDEMAIPAMLEKAKNENLDLVVASRHVEKGGMGEFSKDRVALSNLGKVLSAKICRVQVSDPMSGFFLITREYFHEVVHDLSCVGFKILVDLLASARRPVRVGEVAYTFRNRLRGDSKLTVLVALEYGELLLHKLTRGIVPSSYLLFGAVGAIGVACNFILAEFFMNFLRMDFRRAQLIGACLTIAINFFLNNHITFRNTRLRGIRIIQGLGIFYLSCLVGLFAQVAIASSLRAVGSRWMVATLVGIFIGSVWNYSMAFLLTWNVSRHRAKWRNRRQFAYLEPRLVVAEPSHATGLANSSAS